MDIEIGSKEYFELPVHKRHLIDRREHNNNRAALPKLAEIERHLQRIRQEQIEIDRLRERYGIKDKREKARDDKFCQDCRKQDSPIFNLENVHYLDGDHSNKAHGNIAVICPSCQSHILLCPFTSQDIAKLKMRGLSNAAIGRYLGLSRERVGQLLKTCDMESVNFKIPSIDQLIEEEQEWEKENGRKRVTDKRTLKKRIVARLNKGAIRGRIPK